MDFTPIVNNGFNFYWKSWQFVEHWRRHFNDFTLIDPQNFLLIENLQNNNLQNSDYGQIRNRIINSEINSPVKQTHSRIKDFSNQEHNSELDVDSDESELEFVINDEMVAFFEQSMRHKMELRKARELSDQKENLSNSNQNEYPINKTNSLESNKNVDRVRKCKKNILQRQKNKNYRMRSVSPDFDVQLPTVNKDAISRTEEMIKLYGDDASKICGMETALQLSFDRLCDMNNSVHWPCIPFKP